MKLEEALSEYRSIVDTYYGVGSEDCDAISELAKNLSVILSYLSWEQHVAHVEWVKIIENSTIAYNRSENLAYYKVPQLYMLRKVVKSGYEILNIMRSNISYSKSK